MRPLLIESSEDSPKIVLDAASGNFEISERSLPEDAPGFYLPVIEWLTKYSENPSSKTNFVIKLEYHFLVFLMMKNANRFLLLIKKVGLT